MLWFGTYGGGLNRFDRATERFFAYRHDDKNPNSLSSDMVVSLLVDRRGVLWVGTQREGLNRFDAKTGRFSVYRNDPQNSHSLSDDWPTVMFEDRSGIFWVGTSSGGLNRFDPKTEQFTAYRNDVHDPHSLSHNKVNSIREDRRGRLWIGTQGGFNLFDRVTGIFTRFTRKDGLPDDGIEAILEDDGGYLWLTTHYGLSRFDPLKRTFRNYSESDGLPGNLFNPDGPEASAQAADGRLILGSSRGVTTFYPKLLSDNLRLPPVLLTEFSLFNKPVIAGAHSPLHKPIWSTDSLTLAHAQSIFTIEFSALSYSSPQKNRYRYRLEDLETDWNEVDSRRRQATYTNLAARELCLPGPGIQPGSGVEREGRRSRHQGPAAMVGELVAEKHCVPNGSGPGPGILLHSRYGVETGGCQTRSSSCGPNPRTPVRQGGCRRSQPGQERLSGQHEP